MDIEDENPRQTMRRRLLIEHREALDSVSWQRMSTDQRIEMLATMVIRLSEALILNAPHITKLPTRHHK